MGEVIVLRNEESKALLIEEQPGINWYSCSLASGDERLELGAESRTYIVSHLLAALRGSGEITGQINGKNVQWALSLAERHFSLYVQPSGDEKLFYWQSPDGQSFHVMHISPRDSQSWQHQLESWQEQTEPTS